MSVDELLVVAGFGQGEDWLAEAEGFAQELIAGRGDYGTAAGQVGDEPRLVDGGN